MLASLIGALALAAASVVALLGSRHLPVWEWTTPGAGLYAIVLGVALLGCSLLGVAGVIGESLVRRAGQAAGPPESGPSQGEEAAQGGPASSGWWRVALFAATCLAWALALKQVGFGLSSAIAGGVVAWLLEPRSRGMAVVVGATGAVVATILFVHVLGMQLP